jgi:hypothetical protein
MGKPSAPRGLKTRVSVLVPSTKSAGEIDISLSIKLDITWSPYRCRRTECERQRSPVGCADHLTLFVLSSNSDGQLHLHQTDQHCPWLSRSPASTLMPHHPACSWLAICV